MAGQQEVVYRIDSGDGIVFVSDQWDRFAANNAGDNVRSTEVLGHSLWDYIGDMTTQQIYRQIIKRSREGIEVGFTLRCDSPDCRRVLRMDIRQTDDGTVEFRSRVISEEPRPAVSLLDSRQPRTDDLISVCSWCERVLVDGRWVSVEDAITALGLFQQDELPALTHGMCQDCSESMNKVIANL